MLNTQNSLKRRLILSAKQLEQSGSDLKEMAKEEFLQFNDDIATEQSLLEQIGENENYVLGYN